MEPVEPVAEAPGEIEERPLICPWCDSHDVEKVSEYGPHLMVYQYICRSCHSPFEAIKR